MRLLLSILLLCALALGGRTPARAQAAPLPATYRADSPAAATDTAATLHRYFARRRRSAHVTLGVGAGILAAGYTVAAVNNKGGNLGDFLLGVLGTVVSVPFIAQGVVLSVQYSRRQEQRVLQAWQQHRLPQRIARRALVPEYNQPPTPH